MRKIADWFWNLSKREQYIVGGGGIVVLLLVVYYIIWLPLQSHAQSAQRAFINNQRAYIYIQHARQRLLLLRRQQNSAPKAVSNIMVAVEHALAEAKLSSYLRQVQQPALHQVSITLQAVPFDHLIAWLQQFVQQYLVKVTQFHVTQTSTPGVVNTRFVLQKI